MADVKLSALTEATTLSHDDKVYGIVSGNSRAIDINTLQQIPAIADSKAVTAVDVFVYDTSKDSDGGAWRKRTQHTSWYNETLNTATRGSRREFPAVAVIVAETNKVTIYDGDDPTLPMWMVFENNTADLLGGGGSMSSISFVNGVLCVGTTDRINYVSFLQDFARRHRTTGIRAYSSTLSGRNDGSGFDAEVASLAIVNNTVNDVAMTVLPDAPIDAATGLPVPTIAVATDGGVSVITDSGAVYDNTIGGLVPAARVFWDKKNRLHANRKASGPNYYISEAANIIADNWSSDLVFAGTSTPPIGDGATNAGFNMAQADGHSTAFAKIGAYSTSDGFGFLHAGTSLTSSMIALTTSTYNTGWMNGDIKGAFLSSTDATSLVGSGELVTNGTFDADVSGWTITADDGVNNTVVWDASGAANLLSDGAAAVALTWGGLSTSKQYWVTFDLTVTTGGVKVWNGSSYTAYTSTGTYTHVLRNDASLQFYRNSGATDVLIDNVSLREAQDADRSVNNNGLIVNGTVTRSPVATGADLVAYSGFSASNYLEQPYNSDLDFGTGDFCVMGWVKDASTGYTTVMSKTPAGTRTAPYFDFGFDTSTAVWGGGVIYKANAVSSGWSFVSWVRSSGVLYLYVNGVQLATAANTENYSHSNTDVLYVGKRGDDGRSAPSGGLALLRISATAPTAEQITKIYNDEKVLFQENAQATLYGASDAVTALAHDSDTNLLHVGTSAGRSVFQGLRRVSNTTTAVGTAISASNGLVVEE